MMAGMKVLLDAEHEGERFSIVVNPVDPDRQALRVMEVDGFWMVVVPEGMYRDIVKHDSHARFFKIARSVLTAHMGRAR